MVKMLIELAVMLAIIMIGSRVGGIGLGVWGGIGVFALATIFGVEPTVPPVDVLLIILSVVVAAATMEAAGGVDYMVRIAERIIRSNPKRITFVAPLVTYAFTVGAGTGHLLYPLLPVIHEVAREGGIRPERPISIATIANQIAIVASPVSASTAAAVVIFGPDGWSIVKILAITVPSTLIGSMVGALSVLKLGKDLDDDPEYQRRLAAGEIPPIDPSHADRPPLPPRASWSAGIFLLGVLAIVISGAFPSLRPDVHGADGKVDALAMPYAIEVLMLATAALIMVVCKVNAAVVPGTPVAKAGLVALVGVFGLAWLGDSFVEANKTLIVDKLGNVAKDYPWTFAIIVTVVAALILSQAATTKTMMPLGMALGIPSAQLVAMLPAVAALFILPVYPTSIAAVNFDLSGTTHFGKYVLNHSFMRPGLVTLVASIAIGYGLAAIIG
ncbi:C4-dicarboxylate ABC transporter [Nocardia seriolae]|nr:C4-dicarboxylate ABC transporter [Nocardia seriolae]PSK29539.1 anaerobic C4-dicarboxylate transporter [Nocardia seriolae]QOW32610.1 anaerobic C4-dicarboxylate transporter [Nocardia seriolae]